MLEDIDINDLPIMHVKSSERLNAFSSSLGNQIKWKHNDKFVKLNCLGYENTAEVLVSYLLSFTDLSEKDYVKYHACLIYEDGKRLGTGCFSQDFVGDAVEITVASLLDEGLQSYSISYDDLRDYLFGIVGFDVKSYIDTILCVDAMTRNDDRHFKNISFLYSDGKYSPAPIFDNGAACMSDMLSYPLEVDFDTNYSSISAKPFYTDFSRNLVNNRLLKLHYDDFVDSVNFSDRMSVRALKTVLRALSETEGIAWERC